VAPEKQRKFNAENSGVFEKNPNDRISFFGSEILKLLTVSFIIEFFLQNLKKILALGNSKETKYF
jgi:hypothetical protein